MNFQRKGCPQGAIYFLGIFDSVMGVDIKINPADFKG